MDNVHTLGSCVVTAALLMPATLSAATADALSTEQLQKRVEERDAAIAELVRRVEVLERKLGRPSDPGPVRAAPAAASGSAATANPAAAAATSIDEEQVNRALERALVREGGLVLPRGVYELEPRLTYTHRATDALQIVTIGGVAQIAQQTRQRDSLEAAMGFRVGLPWTSQIDVRVPHVYRHERTATLGAGESRDRAGLGDVELALTKQLTAGRAGAHGLLATVNYKTTTGSSNLNDQLAPGSGFPAIQAALTGVRRQDPLVFYGTLSHTLNIERTRSGSDVDPGDVTGLKLGMILAANPETSLRFAFELNRLGKTKLDGARVAGTDTTQALLELGFATVLSPRSLLDFRAGIGLTPSSPDFRLEVALPVRFY